MIIDFQTRAITPDPAQPGKIEVLLEKGEIVLDGIVAVEVADQLDIIEPNWIKNGVINAGQTPLEIHAAPRKAARMLEFALGAGVQLFGDDVVRRAIEAHSDSVEIKPVPGV